MFLMDGAVSSLISNKINDLLYSDEKIKAHPDKKFTAQLPFSARTNQMLAAEISSNARSLKNKINSINKNGNMQKYQEELLRKYEAKSLQVKWTGNLNIDSRFVSIEKSKTNHFTYWANFKFPETERIVVPLTLTRHMRNLLDRGYTLKTNTLKLCRDGSVTLIFSAPEQALKKSGEVVGVDIGRNKAFVCSNGSVSNPSIKEQLNSLKNKKHGSKNKRKAVLRMKQCIDKSVKDDMKWADLRAIVLENLTGMKVGFRRGNVNHHWTYAYIQNRIRLRGEELDVQVSSVHPAGTSQSCAKCGYRHKNNRKNEKFLCTSCGHEDDADYNASLNIRNRWLNSTNDKK